MKYKKITKCQISQLNQLEKILSLGLIPPVNQMSHLNSSLNDQVFSNRIILFKIKACPTVLK